MRPRFSSSFAVLPLVVCAVFAGCASAADAPVTPVKGVAACIAQDGDFHSKGKVNTYVFTITNTCEKRLKCTVDAYVTTAKGPDSGHGTLIVGPKSQGAAAKRSFTMRVKAPGGTAQVSHSCNFI